MKAQRSAIKWEEIFRDEFPTCWIHATTIIFDSHKSPECHKNQDNRSYTRPEVEFYNTPFLFIIAFYIMNLIDSPRRLSLTVLYWKMKQEFYVVDTP